MSICLNNNILEAAFPFPFTARVAEEHVRTRPGGSSVVLRLESRATLCSSAAGWQQDVSMAHKCNASAFSSATFKA